MKSALVVRLIHLHKGCFQVSLAPPQDELVALYFPLIHQQT